MFGSSLGLNKFELEQKISFSIKGLTSISQNRELTSLAERLASGVAEAIEANNQRIESQVKDLIDQRIKDLTRGI